MLRNPALLALLGTCAGAAAAAPPPVHAERQAASATTRTIFRCDVGGRTLYTDTPCTGARSMVPVAVQGIRPAREGYAAAETLAWSEDESSAAQVYQAQPYALYPRSTGYVSPVDPECPHLAQRMALVEAEARAATTQTLQPIQERLSIKRQRYRELGC